MNIFGISGSLRKQSYNSYLLAVAASLLAKEIDFKKITIDLPLFNQDLEKQMPELVLEFKKMIEIADGLIIITPEYNHGTSGVLKNAIDWASRPAYQSSLKDKKVLCLSSSMGNSAGKNGLAALKDALTSCASEIYPDSYSLAKTYEAFDENGNLIDAQEVEKVKKLIDAFVQSV